MLDFYSIADHQSTPEYPEELGLRFIGGLEMETHTRLQAKGIIGKEFDYYSDFRWDSKEILRIKKRIELSEHPGDTDLKKLIMILDQVSGEKMGVAAYCD